MFRTKAHVDTHVVGMLKGIKDKQQRLLRGYQIAKLYFDVKEYEKAKEFLLGFISIKDNNASSHSLLGKILEAQCHPSEAAAAYRKSLDVDPQQGDVLLKICELYSQINISPDLAGYWAEKGEKQFPTNDVIFKLKMKAHSASSDGNNPEELLSFLAVESAKCPSDPKRRVKLVRSYMDLGRINEAYTTITEIEAQELYHDSIDWYHCIVDVYREYKRITGSNVNGKFHQQLLNAMNRLTALTIERSLTIVEAIGALWSLDQELMEQSRNITSGASDDWKVMFHEIEAQYLLHCGTLILNKAQKDRLSWRDATDMAYVCFLVSHSVPVVTRKSPWYAKATADEKKIYDRWYKESCWRCSQTGHMLMQKYQSSDGGQKWIDRIKDEFCHQLGKDKLFHLLFTQPQQKDAKEQSYLNKCSLFANDLLLPDKTLLMEWDNVVQQDKADSLQVAVWICLHYYSANDKTQPRYPFSLFEKLPFGTKNLDTANPETLCQLDVQAFLYAAVRSAAVKQLERRNGQDPRRPNLLPVAISERLCSEAQCEWWTCAYKLHMNTARESLSRMRSVLMRGLETIRLVGMHGMDVDLVVHLARTFTEQLEETKCMLDSAQELNLNLPFMQARAVHYWHKSTELLEHLQKRKALPVPRHVLFDSRGSRHDEKELTSFLDEGRLFQAMEARESGQHSEAIRLFSQIKTADATFQSALLHKELAVIEIGNSQNESLGSERARLVTLLKKARNDLYETLDRLKGDKYHILNSRVAEEIDDVETRLMRLEKIHGNSFDQEEDEDSMSGIGNLESYNFKPRSDPVIHSTPHIQRCASSEIGSRSNARVRPSPDRLDAQIRSLTYGQDQWLKIIMDEMKDNRTTIQKLQERVTILESKLHDVQEQNKQFQNIILATAVPPQSNLATPGFATQAPPPATLLPPTQVLYPSSAYRGEGYDYWGSHSFDPAVAIHGNMLRSYQQPLPAGYGVSCPTLTPKGLHPPQHYPASANTRHEIEDLTGEQSFGFYGDEYHFQAHIPVATLDSVPSVGVTTAVPALQPGFFDCLPKSVVSENNLLAARTTPAVGNSRAGSKVTDPVIAITPKSGIFQVPSSSLSAGERVLPVPTSLHGSKNQTAAGDAQATELNESTEPHFKAIVELSKDVYLKGDKNADKCNKAGMLTANENNSKKNAQISVTSTPTSSLVTTVQVSKPPAFSFALNNSASLISVQQPKPLPFSVLTSSTTVTSASIQASKPLMFGAAPATLTSVPSKPFGFPLSSALSEPFKVQPAASAPSMVLQKPISAVKQQAVDTSSSGHEKASSAEKSKVESIGLGTPSVTSKASSVSSSTTGSLFPSSASASSAATATQSTWHVGGFSFNKPPVIKEVEKDVPTEKKDEPKHTNAFAGFVFLTPGKSAVDSAVPGATIKWPTSGQISGSTVLAEGSAMKISDKAKSEKHLAVPGDGVAPDTCVSKSIFGQSSGTSALSFEALAISGSGIMGVAQKTENGEIFKSKGQRLFVNAKSPEKGEEGNEDGEDEYVPNQSFEALVSLPEVEVVTGEENEIKLFGERAKLYRMDNEPKQWKDRGTGEIKILKNVAEQKFRILMRRDQVLKVCANHYITPKIKLLPMKTSDSSWCWFAQDFSEGEIHEEQLCIKFKTVEQADKFKTCFEDCQSKLSTNDSLSKKADIKGEKVASVSDKKEVVGSASAESLSSLFKPKAGEWQCETCYVQNSSCSTKCAACETLKPGTQVRPKPSIENLSHASFLPVSSQSLSSLFKPKEGEWQCTMCYVNNAGDKMKCAACETPKSGTKVETKHPEVGTKGSVGSASVESLSSLFKPKAGEWQCETCYVQNSSGSTKCAACETQKPGTQVRPKPSIENSVEVKIGPSGGFSINSNQTMSFGKGFGSTTTEAGFGKHDATISIPKPTGFGQVSSNMGQFVFGSSKSSNAETSVTRDAVDSTTPISKPTGFGQVSSNFGQFAFGGLKSANTEIAVPKITIDTSKPPTHTTSDASLKISSFGPTAGTTQKEQLPGKDAAGVSKGFVFGNGTAGFATPKSVTATTMESRDYGTTSDTVFSFGRTSTSSSSFAFAGKGFSLGVPELSKVTDFEKTEDKPVDKVPVTLVATSGKDGAKPAFGYSSFSFLAQPSLTTAVASKELSVTPTTSHVKSFGLVTPVGNTISSNSSKSPISPQSPDGGLYRNAEGEDDHIVFEPVVKLPENVEVKTGEEDEEVLYCHRAKLYRYLGNEWKERGVGDVKILQNKETKQVRLLMRREKVLRICMNHLLLPEMSLKLMPNTEGKVLNWHAEDFADGEAVHEKFSMRFKSADVAAEFQDAFNKVLEQMKATKSDSKKDDGVETFKGAPTTETSVQPSSNSLLLDLLMKPSTLLQQTQGDSDCEVLSTKEPSSHLLEQSQKLQLSKYFYNYLEAPDCPGCVGCDADSFDFGTIGQPVKIEASSSETLPLPVKTTFVFGGSSSFVTPKPPFGTGFSGNIKATEMNAATPHLQSQQWPVFGGFTSSLQPAPSSSGDKKEPAPAKFVFGAAVKDTGFAALTLQNVAGDKKAEKPSCPSQLGHVFGSVNSQTDFASLASKEAQVTSFGLSKDPNFKWEGTGATLFSTTPKSAKHKEEENDEAGSGEEEANEEEPNVTFVPVVTLAEVEVKTGEEDEEPIFKGRAKLYRFDNGQWKERGVGDMKIMKHKQNGNFRLLLRRDQVHKVACNQKLTLDMKLKPLQTSESAWCWFAHDYSDAESKLEQFALKFKTSELANEFKAKFEDCQQELSTELSRGENSETIAAIPVTNTLDVMHHVPSSVVPAASASEAGYCQSVATDTVEDSAAADMEDEETVLFSKRASLTYRFNDQTIHAEKLMVNVTASEDEDVGGYRLKMLSDNAEFLCNHIICSGYQMKRLDTKNTCEWSAKDFATDEPIRKTFQLTFSSAPALEEFEKIFEMGQELAVRSELSESKADEFNPGVTDEDDYDDDDDYSDDSFNQSQ